MNVYAGINSPERVNSPERINSPEHENSPERINSPEQENSPERINSPERVNSPERINSPVRFRMARTVVRTKLMASAPESPTGVQGSTTIIEKDPGPTFAINQGPFMNPMISRKREHLSERQRVVRTLEIIEFMGPIAKVGPRSIGTQQSS